ncbi:unnamed protein product [Hyaloperonospora brassicae]|uniref:Mitochondrial import inner membrane translocase subunit Tim21 n=1 Tax=Hyaloperonospora brassicae TaxID=162125 RepID=A0AAV0T0S8_HYABA|nr:unnamed protein product [Hyaloperonospora brassicae]
MFLHRLRSPARASALARGFASSSTKRPKPIRVAKTKARRVLPEAPKPSNALTEVPAYGDAPTTPIVQSESQTRQTFGGAIKESFIWGVGMAAAFSVVGILFSRMEEATASDKFDGSFVVADKDEEINCQQ